MSNEFFIYIILYLIKNNKVTYGLQFTNLQDSPNISELSHELSVLILLQNAKELIIVGGGHGDLQCCGVDVFLMW